MNERNEIVSSRFFPGHVILFHIKYFFIEPETQTEVCLHRDRNEEGEEIVRITAFVISSSGTEPMLERVVRFSDEKSARFFVDDYSEVSANGFLRSCLEEEGVRVGYFAKPLPEFP